MTTKAFKEVKESIESALEEIKTQNIELYEYLKKNIVMDETNDRFSFQDNRTPHD